jgi:60 kDa SS-A/Ro ribonucleoprotein
MQVDCFVVLTDSETWAGGIHPTEALRQYRDKMGIPARLLVRTESFPGVVLEIFPNSGADDKSFCTIIGFLAAWPPSTRRCLLLPSADCCARCIARGCAP